MTLTFERATKRQAKARIAITGPAGSGKTYTGLKLATEMVGKKGRVALIDTEHGSASKYADEFSFDTLSLANFHPERYIEAIKAASDAGYDALVIDSASHEWFGVGGCLELVDAASARLKGNSYVAWKDVTPLHNRFIEAIHQSDLHLIATFRSKMDYVQSERDGRKTVDKLGMAPITREGAEYEFDIVLDMDLAHTGVINKSRAKALADSVIRKPGTDLAKAITAWLTDGAPAPKNTPEAGTVPSSLSLLSADSVAPLPASDSAANGHIATEGDRRPLYELAKALPQTPQTPPQIDALIEQKGYDVIQTRLINAHKLQCGSSCQHITGVAV